jgi:hypothetical protein
VTQHRDAHDATIEIVASDLTWPCRFDDERLQLQALLAPWLVAGQRAAGAAAGALALSSRTRYRLWAAVES